MPRCSGTRASQPACEAEAALVFFDGELADVLGPGRYGYWQVGRKVTAKALDTRPVPLDVTAQRS